MEEITFLLKQHTPLLHFLHDQPGATLRATELKPKLDRFIVEVFQNWPENANGKHEGAIRKIKHCLDQKEPSLYRINIHADTDDPRYYYYESNIRSADRDALPYTISNQYNIPLEKLEIIFPSTFFANADKRSKKQWDEVKLGVLHSTVRVTVRSFDEDIINLIEVALPHLICIENFGTRQSKGYGCFSDLTMSTIDFEKIVKRHFVFVAKRRIPDTQANISKVIDSTYRQIRCKPDRDGGEPESFIRDYFEDQNPPIVWEKEQVIRTFIHEESAKVDKNVRFVRAVLGLPGLYDYQQAKGKPKVTIRDKAKEIDRYRSPLTFKIHNGWLYLLASHTEERILKERPFLFFKGEEPDENAVEIKTPGYFDISDFLTSKIPTGWNKL